MAKLAALAVKPVTTRRKIIPTTVALPRANSLQDNLDEAIRTLNADRLLELKADMIGNDVIMSHRVYGHDIAGVESLVIHASPLAVLLEYIKLCPVDMVRFIPAALTVMVRDWVKDPNADLKVTEVRRSVNSHLTTMDITCTAMSWLMRKRDIDAVHIVNMHCCIATLIALGAVVSRPFKLTPSDPYTPNGLSLPFVAIKRIGSLRCADTLLDGGSRFLPTDPSPMCAAMRDFIAEDAVTFFHRNWIAGRLTTDDVIKMETSGSTAMHIFIADPMQTEAEAAVRILNMMLEMGFKPSTERGDGTTALAYAESRAMSSRTTPTKQAVFEHLRALQLDHDRQMAVAVLHSMKALPKDMIGNIWERLSYGVSMDQANAAVRRVKLMKRAAV
jgi:hypothetical protein